MSMKKTTYTTLFFFFASVLVNNANRAWSSTELINPFVLERGIEISIAWYAKHIAELSAYILFMLCVVSILRPVENHLQKVQWIGHNYMLTFVSVWHRIFVVTTWIGGLDLFHYLIAFRQWDNFFLIQNLVFFILTSYYLWKAYKQ